MGLKISTVISLLCAVVYLATLGIAANHIMVNITERRSLAEREFNELADRISAAAVLGFMEQPFLEAVKDGLQASLTLRAIIVSGPSGSEYAVENGEGYLSWLDDIPRFQARFGVNKEPYFAPLRIEGVRNASLLGVAEYVDFQLIRRILRYALYAIASALLLALVTLFIESLIYKNRKAPVLAAVQNVDEKAHEPILRMEEESFEIPSLDPAIQEEDEDTPIGLYSPRSDVCWESYTMDRLASELHRSASFEQDLVYMILEFINQDSFHRGYREFAAAAIAFFNFKDLIFERGEEGLSIILPNVDLDQGFRMAEEFRNNLLTRSPIQPLLEGELRIGLSSRSGRLVDVERLVLETERALAKAKESPKAPIVAFKSDPERYREFIRERS